MAEWLALHVVLGLIPVGGGIQLATLQPCIVQSLYYHHHLHMTLMMLKWI